MDKKAKIYIAGHTGLVGSALLRKLKEKGYSNLIFKNSSELDLCRQADTESFFKQEKPEYVFLAAAKVGGILANNTYKAEFIYDNLTIAANVIQAAYKYETKKLLNLGSSCIYPKSAPQPMKEEYLLSGMLEPTNEPYAVAKISAIKLCRYYNEQYGTNFISVMPTNLYGPNDNFNLETAHVLPALIRKFYLANLLKEEKYNLIIKNIRDYPLGFRINPDDIGNDSSNITQKLSGLGINKTNVCLWGSGESYREFLHVDDLALACVFLMERYDYKDIGELINVGSGKDLKIKELAEMVKNIIGFDGDIVWDKTRPDGPLRKLLDVSRIKSLGWSPAVDLKIGITSQFELLKK